MELAPPPPAAENTTARGARRGREAAHSDFRKATEQGLSQRLEHVAALRTQSRSHTGTETLLGDRQAKAEVGGRRRARLFHMWEMALTEAVKGQGGVVWMHEPGETLPHPKSDCCSAPAQSPCDLPKTLTLFLTLALQTLCKLDTAPS